MNFLKLFLALLLLIGQIEQGVYASDPASTELPIAEPSEVIRAKLVGVSRTDVTLSGFEDESDRAAEEEGLKDDYLKLASLCQGSSDEVDQELASFCVVQSARFWNPELTKAYRKLFEDAEVTQAGLSDGAPYDFGKVARFLAGLGGLNGVEELAKSGKSFRCVFSIDGGGIRGIIPALFFQRLEEKLGCSISEIGDLFAGTSVGGIIACGLNRPIGPIPATELVNLFKTRGEEIFPRAGLLTRIITAPFKYISQTFFSSRYSPGSLETMMTGYFGESWLHEVEKPLLVTTIDTTSLVTSAREFYFDSGLARAGRHDQDFRLRDIARATSAATTFFPAATVRSYNDTAQHVFVDAGITVNNPALHAYQEAKRLYPTDRIIVFSFGTGDPIKLNTIPRDAGAARSAEPLINNMMAINSEQTHWRFLTELKAGDGYVRVQCPLAQDIKLDGVSDANLRYLEEVAEVQMKEIDLIADFLVRNRAKTAAPGTSEEGR